MANGCPLGRDSPEEQALADDDDQYNLTSSAAARAAIGVQLANGGSGIIPLARRGRPPTRRPRTPTRPRRIQASVTVWRRNGIMDTDWDKAVEFLHQQEDSDPGFAAFFAMERGPREGGLHIQGVIDIKSTSTQKINGDLKRALVAADDDGHPLNVMVRQLSGRHLHTWIGMVGYCQKDMGQPHYKFHSINVTTEDLDNGVQEYTMHGAGDIKNRQTLDAKTLLQKIELWWKFKVSSCTLPHHMHSILTVLPITSPQTGCDPNMDVITILRDMLRSGHFFPSMSWIIPPGGSGVSQEKLSIMFELVRNWEKTTRSEVRTLFFAPDLRYTNLHMELCEDNAAVELRPWQAQLLEIIITNPDPRAVLWYWEPVGNAGKSFMARHLLFHYNAVVVQLMRKEDMLHVLTKSITEKTRVVVFDLVRCTDHEEGYSVVYEVMEMIKDRLLCSGKYNSTMTHLKALHVVAFSNYEPDTSAMSADRWNVVRIPPSGDSAADAIVLDDDDDAEDDADDVNAEDEKPAVEDAAPPRNDEVPSQPKIIAGDATPPQNSDDDDHEECMTPLRFPRRTRRRSGRTVLQ